MIAIIDNGELYSDHHIYFVKVNDKADAEALMNAKLERSEWNRHYIIAIVESVEWRDDSELGTPEQFLRGYK